MEQLSAKLTLWGWSPKSGRMMATTYAKNDNRRPNVVEPISGQLASPGQPLRGTELGMAQADLIAAGQLQACYLNEQMGRKVAGRSSAGRISPEGVSGAVGSTSHTRPMEMASDKGGAS
jgi:hypothetical protein